MINTKLNLTNPKLHLLSVLLYRCYQENETNSDVVPGNYTEDTWCPRTFDGFACWDDTPGGATAYQQCPDFVIGFDPKRYAFRRCTENGTWFKHPEGSKSWTNYTTCVDIEDLDIQERKVDPRIVPMMAKTVAKGIWSLYGAIKSYFIYFGAFDYGYSAEKMKMQALFRFRSVVNVIYVVGYAISVAALLISLVIFMYFRSLQCTRIRIHMHLFTSFAINNVLWIVWYDTVVNTVSVVQENKEWCQALHVITNYFMVTSYLWMFCEGLHLHISLVVVFVQDQVAMRWFVAIGWGLPLVILAVYSAVRYHSGATERCWMDQSDSFWIIIVPVVVSLLASFVFLINVVRVLLTKLHPAPNQRATLAVKKAARATLILIPLFGLHFILIPLRPSPDSSVEKLYQVVSALLTSLQGLCVSVLFCFTNHDVTTAVHTHLSRYIRNNERIPMTGVTSGESVINTRENVV